MLQRRQADAKQAVRKHIDEVTFQVGKDSRDMLRRTQRQLRDHFSTLAEEVSTSIAASVAAAQSASRPPPPTGSAGSATSRPSWPGSTAWPSGPASGGQAKPVGGHPVTSIPPNLPLGASVRLLLRRTIDTYADSPQAAGWLRHNLARFDEPLRVAIAAR